MIDYKDMLARHTAPVPRYTSYPTAPNFAEGVGKALFAELLARPEHGERVSVYIHIPYCDRLCWFCGCHTKQTRQYAPVTAYVDVLVEEIRLLAGKAGWRPVLGEVHFGGGSPSMLHSDDMIRIREALGKAFVFDKATQTSVEIDPNDHTQDMIAGLKAIGLTRASIGVQDFDPSVQQAINRPQTFEQTRDLVHALRSIGIGSINIDALYGLPLQTKGKLENTIRDVISMAPERIAMFGYAHVPWVKKHQGMIREEDLPGALERYEQAELSESLLLAGGYRKIGIDHYALPADRLSQCAETGNLRRNFQGYTTDQCDTLIGLGASSIGQSRDGYFQNLVPTGQYMMAIKNGTLPALKGYRFTTDDRIRSWIIERLMCNFEFRFDALEQTFGSRSAPYVAESISIACNERDGMCRLEEGVFKVSEDALAFTRIVAARFDAHLKESSFRFSKAI